MEMRKDEDCRDGDDRPDDGQDEGDGDRKGSIRAWESEN